MDAGRTLVGVALGLQAMFALGHLGGVAATIRSAKGDARLGAVFDSLRAYTFRLGGLDSNLWKLRQYFSIAYSVMLVWLGAITLAAMLGGEGSGRTLAWVALIDASGMLAIGGLSLYFGVVQGAVSSALIAGCYGAGWWLLRS